MTGTRSRPRRQAPSQRRSGSRGSSIAPSWALAAVWLTQWRLKRSWESLQGVEQRTRFFSPGGWTPEWWRLDCGFRGLKRRVPARPRGSGRARYRVDDPVDHLRRLTEIIARVGQAVDRR